MIHSPALSILLSSSSEFRRVVVPWVLAFFVLLLLLLLLLLLCWIIYLFVWWVGWDIANTICHLLNPIIRFYQTDDKNIEKPPKNAIRLTYFKMNLLSNLIKNDGGYLTPRVIKYTPYKPIYANSSLLYLNIQLFFKISPQFSTDLQTIIYIYPIYSHIHQLFSSQIKINYYSTCRCTSLRSCGCRNLPNCPP